jgi:hypothetical protein
MEQENLLSEIADLINRFEEENFGDVLVKCNMSFIIENPPPEIWDTKTKYTFINGYEDDIGVFEQDDYWGIQLNQLKLTRSKDPT